jgi:hypothetical protein
LNGHGGAPLVSSGAAKVLAIEPSDQLIQELFGSWTVAIVQRQAEPIAKALRQGEMSACLLFGVRLLRTDITFSALVSSVSFRRPRR